MMTAATMTATAKSAAVKSFVVTAVIATMMSAKPEAEVEKGRRCEPTGTVVGVSGISVVGVTVGS